LLFEKATTLVASSEFSTTSSNTPTDRVTHCRQVRIYQGSRVSGAVMEEDLRCCGARKGLRDPLTVGGLKAKDANHPSARSSRGVDAHQRSGQST